LLNLIKSLLAEVLYIDKLVVVLLQEFACLGDTGPLEAVKSANGKAELFDW